MDNSIQGRMQRIFTDVFSLPAEHIMPETSPDIVETWDSLNHLNLVLALEQEFGLQFTPEEIEQLLSFAHIAAILNKKLSIADHDR